MKAMRFSTDAKYILAGIACVLVYCLPYIILGENAYIPTGDFLDSTIAHLRNIIANNAFFDFGAIIPTMYGIPRNSIVYTSPLDFKTIWFALLPTYWAIVVNIVLVKTIAFVGMYFFLLKTTSAASKWIACVVALIFSFVPYYVDYGITVAGIPMVMICFWNIKDRRKQIISFLLIGLYGFYSSMAMGGFAIGLLVGIMILILWYKEKKLDLRLVLALLVIVVAYLLIDFPTIYNYFFNQDFVSQRKGRSSDFFYFSNTINCIATLIWKNSPGHFGRCIVLPILLSFGFTIVFFYKKERNLRYYLFVYITLYFIIAISYLLPFLPIDFFKSFDFSRITVFYIVCCFVLLSKTISVLYKYHKTTISIIVLIVSMLGVEIETTNEKWGAREHFTNVQLMFNQNKQTKHPTFYKFYDQPLFSKIASELGLKQNYSTKVVSMALCPAGAEYNGFYCLDGYFNNYSIEHLLKFNAINEKEFEKNDFIRNRSLGANKCYVLSAEIGLPNFHFSKSDNTYIKHLETRTDILREMGCEYMFSGVEIKNYKDLGLTFIGDYTSEKSFYKIRVYKL